MSSESKAFREWMKDGRWMENLSKLEVTTEAWDAALRFASGVCMEAPIHEQSCVTFDRLREGLNEQ